MQNVNPEVTAESTCRQTPAVRAKAILTQAKTQYLALCERPLHTQEKAWPCLIGEIQISLQPFMTMAPLYWPELATKTDGYLRKLYDHCVQVDMKKCSDVVRAFDDSVLTKWDSVPLEHKRIWWDALSLLAGLRAKIEHLAEWLDVCSEYVDGHSSTVERKRCSSATLAGDGLPLASTAPKPDPQAVALCAAIEQLRKLIGQCTTDDDLEMFRRVALEQHNPNPRKGYKKDMQQALDFKNRKEVNACLGRVARSQGGQHAEAPDRRTDVEDWKKRNSDLTERIESLADIIRRP